MPREGSTNTSHQRYVARVVERGRFDAERGLSII